MSKVSESFKTGKEEILKTNDYLKSKEKERRERKGVRKIYLDRKSKRT